MRERKYLAKKRRNLFVLYLLQDTERAGEKWKGRAKFILEIIQGLSSSLAVV